MDEGSPDALLARYDRETMEDVFLDIARGRGQGGGDGRQWIAATQASARRIWGLIYRHLCLYRRSWPRLLELAYWPILQMCIWGFTARFITSRAVAGQHDAGLMVAATALLAGVLLWEVALRSQMGVADQLPRGDLVAEPRPCLHQPAAALGA